MKLWEYITIFFIISNINLNKYYFEKVRIHRNNKYYKLPLDICKLIYDDIIIDENDGRITFNYKEEENISYIFEDFARSFYVMHLYDKKFIERI